MTETLQALGIDRMSVLDRLQLVEAIWDTIPDSPVDLELPNWHQEELERRVIAADADPNADIAWDDIMKRLKVES